MLQRSNPGTLSTPSKTFEKSTGTEMYETIVVTIVALSLMLTLVLEIADSIVDRRRIAAAVRQLAATAARPKRRPLPPARQLVSLPEAA